MKHLKESTQALNHFLAGNANDVGVGDCFLCNCGRWNQLTSGHSFCSKIEILVDESNRCFIIRKEFLDGFGILLGKLTADYQASLIECTVIPVLQSCLFPFLRQIERHANVSIFGKYSGGIRNGEHTDNNVACGHLGCQLRVFRQIDNLALNIVSSKDVIQDILGSGALAGGVDGLTGQILYGLNGITVFENVENAQRIYCRNHQCTLGLIIQSGSQVGGKCCDFIFALDDLCLDHVRCSSDGEVVKGIFFVFRVSDHFGHTDTGGAFQRIYTYGLRRLFLSARSKNRENKNHSKKKTNKLFHFDISFRCQKIL